MGVGMKIVWLIYYLINKEFDYWKWILLIMYFISWIILSKYQLYSIKKYFYNIIATDFDIILYFTGS